MLPSMEWKPKLIQTDALGISRVSLGPKTSFNPPYSLTTDHSEQIIFILRLIRWILPIKCTLKCGLYSYGSLYLEMAINSRLTA